jgi:hypothetical protein
MGISGRALAALGCALGIAASAGAQSAPRHVWSHQSGSEGWIGKVVSVGDQGHQVFTRFEGQGGLARLFSGEASQSAGPIWQDSGNAFDAFTCVASADLEDLHASLSYSQSSSSAARHPTISLHASTSPTPLWEQVLPMEVLQPKGGIFVTADGARIVSWVYDWTVFRTRVLVHGPFGPAPQAEHLVDTTGEPVAVRMAEDGSALLLASSLRTTVIALPSGAIQHQAFHWDHLGLAHAISGDGGLLAHSAPHGSVAVLRRQGGAYSSWFTDELPGAVCAAAAFSPDGSTLVLGWNVDGLTVRVRAWDLAGGAPTRLLDEAVGGAGSLQNVVRDVAVSADGARFAVGLSGDQAGLAPEVLAWSRPAGSRAWARSFAFDLPGSVNDVDLSVDGGALGVASKAVHMSVIGGGGRIDLFELGGSDLELEGLPRAGAAVEVRYFGRPGTDAVLLVAPRAAAVPTPFGSAGTLWLERASMSVAGAGRVGPDGVLSRSVALSGAPGETRAFQGLTLAPRALSRDWIRVTLLP